MPKLHLSSSLRRLAEPPVEVFSVSGESVAACLAELVAQHPKLKAHVYQSDGQISPFISVYLNGEDVRFLEPKDLRVKETDKIEVIASLAGG